jgi:hypothetical protein
MDREDIIRRVREVADKDKVDPYSNGFLVLTPEEMERFAALVAAEEREACVKACEEVESRAEELWDKFAYPEDQGMASGARQCTTAIRARSEQCG